MCDLYGDAKPQALKVFETDTRVKNSTPDSFEFRLFIKIEIYYTIIKSFKFKGCLNIFFLVFLCSTDTK
jgi:hypothetical protein